MCDVVQCTVSPDFCRVVLQVSSNPTGSWQWRVRQEFDQSGIHGAKLYMVSESVVVARERQREALLADLSREKIGAMRLVNMQSNIFEWN